MRCQSVKLVKSQERAKTMVHFRLYSILCLIAKVFCFPPLSHSNKGLCHNVVQRQNNVLLFSSREEEIARLEQQLRKLREELKEDDTDDPLLNEDEIEKTRVALEKVKGKDFILSERDLIEQQLMDQKETSGVALLPVLATVAVAVFLFFFAQIPVGQDEYTKYGATGSSVIKNIDLGDLNPDSSRN